MQNREVYLAHLAHLVHLAANHKTAIGLKTGLSGSSLRHQLLCSDDIVKLHCIVKFASDRSTEKNVDSLPDGVAGLDGGLGLHCDAGLGVADLFGQLGGLTHESGSHGGSAGDGESHGGILLECRC